MSMEDSQESLSQREARGQKRERGSGLEAAAAAEEELGRPTREMSCGVGAIRVLDPPWHGAATGAELPEDLVRAGMAAETTCIEEFGVQVEIPESNEPKTR